MDSSPPSAEKPAKAGKSRRLILIAAAAVLLLGGGGAGWYAWQAGWLGGGGQEHEAAAEPDRIAPLEAAYLPLPDLTVALADRPHLVRLGVTLETTPEGRGRIGDAETQRLAEEISRWLAAQTSDRLFGAVALWSVRGRTMALAKDLYPSLPVTDVLVRSLVLQ
jgi:flagellar basal body-associated protein FliL